MVELRKRRGGFSLVEVLVVIALLSLVAGAILPLSVRSLRSGQQQRALDQMERLVAGMVGRPERDEFGFLGDMGGLPAALEDLNDGSGLPVHALNTADGIGYGWAGPYAPTLAPGGTALVDPWNVPFQYSSASAQITSAGADRSFGTADDLVVPASPQPTTGNLSVTVNGVPSGGGPTELLDSSRVDVFVASSTAGVRSETLLAGAGPFTSSGLHLGSHALRAVGSGSYAGATSRSVVVIRRGTAVATITLEQP